LACSPASRSEAFQRIRSSALTSAASECPRNLVPSSSRTRSHAYFVFPRVAFPQPSHRKDSTKSGLLAPFALSPLIELFARHVYHPCVAAGSTKPLKTKNFTFFQVLRQSLAEREGLSGRCLKPISMASNPPILPCVPVRCTNVEHVRAQIRVRIPFPPPKTPFDIDRCRSAPVT
jgi:hypothetical protein